jgi:hypothetical protein
MKYYRVQVNGGSWVNCTTLSSVKQVIKGANQIAIVERIIIDKGDEKTGIVITKTLTQLKKDSWFSETRKDDVKFMQRVMKARIK